MSAELVLDAQAQLGEGPFWHPQQDSLYWVDIEARFLNIFDPESGSNRRFQMPSRIGTAAPATGDEIIVALEDGIYTFDPRSETLVAIVDPEPGQKDNRFNDGKCSPEGRFWAGTMTLTGVEGAAHLYCLHTDRTIETKLSDVTISNGLAWSLSGTVMYYIDTPTHTVRAFDYDPDTGRISNSRVVVTVPPAIGVPDGMTIDDEGMLWVALFYGAAVTRWDPASGTLLETRPIPAKNVTSCAFGGPDRSTLYITTARIKTSNEELTRYPNAGGVFAITPGVTGHVAYEYKG